MAFRFRSKEGRWELVKLPALDSFSFRHGLITLLNCLITLEREEAPRDVCDL
jgi:hypothetical protein